MDERGPWTEHLTKPMQVDFGPCCFCAELITATDVDRCLADRRNCWRKVAGAGPPCGVLQGESEDTRRRLRTFSTLRISSHYPAFAARLSKVRCASTRLLINRFAMGFAERLRIPVPRPSRSAKTFNELRALATGLPSLRHRRDSGRGYGAIGPGSLECHATALGRSLRHSRQTVGVIRRTLKSGCLSRFGFWPAGGGSSRRILGSTFGSTCTIVRPHDTLVVLATSSLSRSRTSGSCRRRWSLKGHPERSLRRGRHNRRHFLRRLTVHGKRRRRCAWREPRRQPRRSDGQDESE